MTFTIPDYANVGGGFIEQSGPDSVDFDTIAAGFQQYGVIGTGVGAVSQRAAGANLSVDVVGGTVLVNGAILSPSSTNVAVTADATNPRWAMVTVDSSGVVAVTLGTAAAVPVMPSVVGKTVLAAVWVPASAASILNANIVDKRIVLKSAPATTVVSGTSFGLSPVVGSSPNYALQDHGHGTPSTPVTSAVAGTGIGVSGATGAVTISNTGVTSAVAGTGIGVSGGTGAVTISNTGVTSIGVGARTGAVALTAADIAAGTFPGANSFTGLQTMNAGLTIPSGQPLTVGTKKTFSGSLSTGSATSNTAVTLGSFSTTSGSLALRFHMSSADSTTIKTKTYEFAVDTTTDVTNQLYKVLPVDASSAQATTNDFVLECYRASTSTTTWQFWIRTSATFAAAWTFAWSAESYGDTVPVYSASNTFSNGSTAATVLHPANSLVAVVGLLGVGTDAPSQMLHMVGGISTVSALAKMVGIAGGSAGLQLSSNNSAAVASVFQAGGAGQGFGDVAVEDLLIQGTSGKTVHIGTASGLTNSTLKVTAADVQINDNGTARTVPRGLLNSFEATASSSAIGTTETLIHTGVMSTPIVSGRHYVIHYRGRLASSATSATAIGSVRISLGSTIGGSGTGSLLFLPFPQVTTSGIWVEGSTRPLLAGTDPGFSAGTQTFSVSLKAGTGTVTQLWASGAYDSNASIWIEDVG